MKTATSPNDIHDIAVLRKRLIEAEKQLVGKSLIIEKLEQINAQLAQRCWGRSSEKHPGQGELSLFNEAELLAMQSALEDEVGEPSDADVDESSETADKSSSTAAASNTPPSKKPRKRRVLPDHLERVRVVRA